MSAAAPTAATALDRSQDTLVIDPVRMNIVNRVAAGTSLAGDFSFKGGLLLQGELTGSGDVAGRLVVWHGARLTGRFKVLGDLYVLGRLGFDVEGEDEATEVECLGTAFVASTGVSTGRIIAARLRMYDGAVLQGPFSTTRPEHALPVLK
ncbi:Integral membrane protein CcmA involved in cell shape determination [Burkholderiales bacterium JOSHI_001]|nr:Integral membrane protein CcmA involved in cell shape determination [Burkholderiales bacterium JOSHI_001]